MRNRNVIQLMAYSAPYKGNFIESILRLEQRLNEEGIQLVYLFPKEAQSAAWSKELINAGKQIYFLSGNKVKDFLLIKTLIRKYRVGIVHTHFIGVATIFSLRLMNLFTKEKCLVVRHLHYQYVLNHSVVEYLKKQFSHVDVSVACSKAVADDYNSKKKDKREKVVSVTNAIEFSRLNEYEVLDRKALEIEEKSFVLLVFGFDYFRKGIDILINAVAQLVDDGVNICLIISFAINREFGENEITIQFGKIPSWIKPVEARNDIGTYYRFSDAFISSSRSEGFCYSLAEAAYCGTQVIASDIFAQKDLNIPYTFQYSVEDIPDLKRSILAAIAVDSDERVRRSAIQKDYVVRTFDLNTWADNIVDIYNAERAGYRRAEGGLRAAQRGGPTTRRYSAKPRRGIDLRGPRRGG
jgi:glycosyltransferase involved in cell wall biosynthesis